MAYLKYHQSFRLRLIFLVVFFAIAFLAVAGKVFRLSIINHRQYVSTAEKQHVFSETRPPERGKIFFNDKYGKFHPAALSKNLITLFASPRDIDNATEVADILSQRLGLNTKELMVKLDKTEDSYEIIAKDISEDDAEYIRGLNWYKKGLFLNFDSRRIYPNDSLGSGSLGFVSFDGAKETGEYGLEKYYQEELSGETGFFEGERDAAGSWVSIGLRILHPPVDGSSIVLSIDKNIQFVLEESLDKLRKKWQWEAALGIILDPTTGKVLAMAGRPTFNPNEYSKEKNYSIFRMPIVDSQFELGSVFKPITMAAAVNEGLVNPKTTYTDKGALSYGAYTIRNFDGKSYGVQTMTQVLEKSLNTGAVFAARLLGKDRFLSYVEKFGFGIKTGIDFPNEISGNVSNLSKGGELEMATASFGQGIAVTPLQMASAIGAIANGGILMKPYIVEKIIDDSGNEKVFGSEEKNRVITKETSETITKMLVSAVRSGFENRAGVKGYFVAGKTGTAQIPAKDRRGYSDDVIHTFVGYAPAFRPKFLILLQLNKPAGNRFAANTLTPAFHDLAEFILNYYEIPPDEK